jgi:RimJ/RimL family protein N-acetyltransferase
MHREVPVEESLIRGDGVVLRTPRVDDVDDIAAACADPQIQRYVPAVPSPYGPPDAVRWVDQVRAGAPDRINWVIADPDTDRTMGAIGLHHLSWEEGTGEIGYWTAPWVRRRGTATAAAITLTNWAVRRGLARIELLTHPENWLSQRVAIGAGYQRESRRRAAVGGRAGRRHDVIVWARLATDPAGPTARVLPDLPAGQLTDGVVALRPLTIADALDVLALHQLPEVVASSVPPRPPTGPEIDRRCAEALGQWLAGERAGLTIRDAATGAFAGEIGLYYSEPVTGQAMIGYSMLPAWRRLGYPTRAARLLAGWAFEATGVARLIAGTAPENIGSQRVLERVGFRREGYQRSRLPGVAGTRIDDILYALLPGELSADQPHQKTAATIT